MKRNNPRLEHVRYVTAKGKTYAYFNSGKRKPNGKPIFVPMPPPGSVGFFDSYAAMKAARTKREKAIYTIADMVRDYERSAAYADHKPNTQALYTKTFRRITALIGEFPVNDLERGDLQLILDNEALGAGSHNIFLAVLGALYKWGRDREKTTLDPAKAIPRRQGGEHEPWPDDIVEAGLKVEHDRTRLAVHLLYFTGQRIGDVCKMRWSDIRDGVIHVVQEKTGKELWIPLLDELAGELARTAKRGMTILANDALQPFSPEYIRKELQAFTIGLGVKTVPHGLRKNAVIAFLMAGCSVAEVAAMTGQTYKVVEHYAKRINQRLMAESAVFKLENMRAKGKPNAKQG